MTSVGDTVKYQGGGMHPVQDAVVTAVHGDDCVSLRVSDGSVEHFCARVDETSTKRGWF